MLPAVAAFAVAGSAFAKPVTWALNFAAPGDYCMVGDVTGDGFADLIRVSPKGDSFIDVAINASGMKCLVPQRANSNWGKDCEAACTGDFDDLKGADIAGLFDGVSLRLAHGFKDGHFADLADWVKLPKKVRNPRMDWLPVERLLAIWDSSSGDGFEISLPEKAITPIRMPKGTVWAYLTRHSTNGTPNGPVYLNDFGPRYRVAPNGSVTAFGDRQNIPVGRMMHGNLPVVVNGQVFVDEPSESRQALIGSSHLPQSPFPDSPSVWAAGDIEGNGIPDLVQFRFGQEPHTGHNVLLYRQIPSPSGSSNASGSTDSAAIRNLDSSGDGLLDDWKLNGFRGLDLKGLGCVPGQKDIICLISRYSNANKEMVESTFKNIEAYYLSLGWHLHPVFLPALGEEDQKRPWWQLRDMFLPAKWRGVAHWMAVTPYGGGQADELSDGGVCGGNNWTLYATFIHEFGHQLGLNHEGFYRAAGCPIYSSLMNYPYSYTFENDIKKIHYSDGALKGYVLRETDLDETIPLPYDKVEFLARAPYHYRLKPNGNTTLIDWNWNGVFGEKHVRADINYSYSTSAGRRDNVGKTQCAPWTFTDGNRAYVLYGQQGVKPDGKSNPSILPDKPGWLFLRRLVKPFQWAEPVRVAGTGAEIGQSKADPAMKDEVTGDPTAITFRGEIVVAYPSAKGLAVRWIRMDRDKVARNELTMVDDSDSVPSFGVCRGKLILLEWSPREGYVRYRTLIGGHRFSDWSGLSTAGAYATIVKSTAAVSMAWDTSLDEVVIGTMEDQDDKRVSRWAIRREKFDGSHLKPATLKPLIANSDREWIQGETGSASGGARTVVLYDNDGITGMRGRILFFGGGSRSEKSPWSCEFVAQSLADKTVHGGWLVKRYYDEWTQSRSGPAACWFDGDILYAYRWVDGSQGDGDNVLHVGYNGTGIESAPMGDFDDIGYIRDFGMENSILYLRQ